MFCLRTNDADPEHTRANLLDQIACHETYVQDIECKIRALEDAKIYLYKQGKTEQAKQKIVERRRLEAKANNVKNVIYTCQELVSQLEEHKVLAETASIMRRVRKQFNIKHGEKALATMEHLMDEHADLNQTLESINGVIAESTSTQLDECDIQAELDAIPSSSSTTTSSSFLPPQAVRMHDTFPSLSHVPNLSVRSVPSTPHAPTPKESVNLMQLAL